MLWNIQIASCQEMLGVFVRPFGHKVYVHWSRQGIGYPSCNCCTLLTTYFNKIQVFWISSFKKIIGIICLGCLSSAFSFLWIPCFVLFKCFKISMLVVILSEIACNRYWSAGSWFLACRTYLNLPTFLLL